MNLRSRLRIFATALATALVSGEALALPRMQPLVEPAIVPSVFHEQSASVASNGDEYLVVWRGQQGVRAARVDTEGSLIDEKSIFVSSQGFYPSVTWIGTSYLVTYGGLYSLIAPSGEILARDQLSFPSNFAMNTGNPTWNGHEILIPYFLRPNRFTVKTFFALFDTQLNLIKNEIALGLSDSDTSFSVAASSGDFEVFWLDRVASPNTLRNTRISGDGTIHPSQPSISGAFESLAAESDGNNVLLAFSEVDTVKGLPAMRSVFFRREGDALTPGPVQTLYEPTSHHPPIAVSKGRNGYLVAWTQGNAVWARRLNTTGNPAEARAVQISRTDSAGVIHGASNGESHLVVWLDGRRGDGVFSDVWGIMLDDGGGSGQEFPVVLSNALQTSPAVASTGQMLLVAWSETASETPTRIVAARLLPDGTVLDPNGIEVSPAGFLPVVSTDGESFLVAWRDPFVSNADLSIVRARLIHSDGSTSPVEIISTRHGLSAPSITFDGLNYLIVWEEDQTIRAARVSREGRLLDFFPFEIARGTNPAVAFNGTDSWVIYLEYRENHLLGPRLAGRRINRNGFLVDALPVIMSDIFDPTVIPRIRCQTESCLVVWRVDNENRQPRGLGAVVLADGGILRGSGDPLFISRDSAERPSIALDGSGYFVAWETRGPEAGDIKGARVTVSGDVVETMILASTWDDESDPAAVVVEGGHGAVYVRSPVSAFSDSSRLYLGYFGKPEHRRPVRR